MRNLNIHNLFSISVVIPTLNCSGFLKLCLDSIVSQEYPKDLIEILIVDGGSTDNTIEIGKNYTNKIFDNPLRTGEAGKAIGVKNAKNELIALIDSDNILPNKNWLVEMVKPLLENDKIVGSEPLEYTYRKSDSVITRYCALTGMNDILCLFIGNYDRHCYLTGKWTEMRISFEDKKNYLCLNFNSKNINQIPTIGANGTIFRKSFFEDIDIGDYLFDIDLISWKILRVKDNIYFAKVRNGIIHLFSGNIKTFIKKQKRRIVDFNKYKNLRNYKWEELNKKGLLKFVAYNLLIIPLIIQTIRGFLKKADSSWFFHVIACELTFYIYVYYFIAYKIFYKHVIFNNIVKNI